MKHTNEIGQLALALVVSLGFTAPASALIIDFEAAGVVQPSGALLLNTGGDFTTQGFRFDLEANHRHLLNDSAPIADSSNGTTNLGIDDADGDNSLSISQVSGHTFSLYRLDIAELKTSRIPSNDDFAQQISVTGFFFGGGKVTTTLPLDGVSNFSPTGITIDFQTFTLNGFTNLTSVVLDGTGSGNGQNAFQVDNINVGAVPEPMSVALLGIGLIGLVSTRRKT